MKNWAIVYFDGFSNCKRLLGEGTYEWARNYGQALPPGYIWHIEEW